MKNIIVFGATEITSWLIHSLVYEKQANIVAITVEKAYVESSHFCGIKVVPFEELDSLFDMSNCQILITIGYNQMNNVRLRIYNQCKEKKYKIYTYISKRAIVDSIDNIGEGSIIMPGAFVGPHVRIGICNIINVGACISHSITIGNFNFIAGNVVFGGNVEMENNCFLGMNTTIINGIHIASYTFVGASALINRDTEEYGVYTAVPTIKKEGKYSLDIVKKV